MNEYHILKYALFAENPNNKEEVFCVNLLSGTFCIFSREEFNKLFKFRELSKNDPTLIKFVEEGIIVNFDEREMFEAICKQKPSTSNSFSLVICPTLNCNFNCPYCFENHRQTKMSLETQNDIVYFLENILQNDKIKNLSVTWYGGEPLLAIDIIDSLSKEIIKLTETYNIKYKAKILTNGYLLTQKNADILAKNKVSGYQITLDGMKKLHDSTRCLINGIGSFDRIIENLTQNKIQGRINIRHNVHLENVDDIDKLRQLIKEIRIKSKNNINYYYSLIRNNTIAENRNNFISVVNKNKGAELQVVKDSQKISIKNGNYCGAQTLNTIVVDDQGHLFKCWEDVDKIERSFGDIKTWNLNNPLFSAKYPDNLLQYLNTVGALNDKECQDCIWLPKCKGGCPTKTLFYKKECVAYKDNPELFVLEVAKNHLKN